MLIKPLEPTDRSREQTFGYAGYVFGGTTVSQLHEFEREVFRLLQAAGFDVVVVELYAGQVSTSIRVVLGEALMTQEMIERIAEVLNLATLMEKIEKLEF